MRLINWLWLEDALVRACEAEIARFGRERQREPFFAFCLEHDGVTGTLDLSYGSRDAVETEAEARRIESGGAPVYYRHVELRPENWFYRSVPIADPDGYWGRVRPHLDAVRETMAEEPEPEVMQFLWLRFEYLAESVVRRLIERDAFRHLRREPEFLAYTTNENESLEELEDRIGKSYPRYCRASVELVSLPRQGELPADDCCSPACSRPSRPARLYRCTHCHDWLCESCGRAHEHPELHARRPFFGC